MRDTDDCSVVDSVDAGSSLPLEMKRETKVKIGIRIKE